MLVPFQVEVVQRLLAETDLSQRAIARETGVSRTTVGNIFHGRRREDSAKLSKPDFSVPPPSGPSSRCPTCGARVYGACHACRVRRLADRRSPESRKHSTGPITLDLRPEHYERYLEVRRQRESCNAD